jgi:hypothetical protein
MRGDGASAAPRLVRTCIAAASGLSFLISFPLAKLLRREPDCWRRTVGLGLRSEATKFGLSAFGLAAGLSTPAHFALKPTPDGTTAS